MKDKSGSSTVSKDKLRLYFILCIFLVLCLSIGAAALITLLIEWLTKTNVIVPTIVWMIVFSIVMGLVLSLLFSRMFLKPILRLSRAMEQVAKGDFSVRLDDAGHFGEMRQSYDNFNTMVKALDTTETLQSDFVSNVSHEFKTPINAIEGYAMLLQDAEESAQQKEYVEKILTSTHRLGDLVNNILLLSKIDNQSFPAERVAYRLDEQLRQALLLHERKWSEKEIELDVDLAPVTYTGPESLMMHVWSNLIDNAIKFDPPGGLLRMRLQEQDGAITVEISDSGEGMTEEQLTHIFDRFYQADGSHQREGNGLGLALVKRILEAVDGEIKVKSTPGQGSTFTVTLRREDS